MEKASFDVDLLHPLKSLEWIAECHDMPVGVYNAQAVVLGNKVYIGGGSMYPGSFSRLLIYDFTEDSCDILDTPTQWYALTAYRSQLVLVGGRDPNTRRSTNQLWVLDEQHHWTQCFPPMTTKRYNASAVSMGNHLFVAGGRRGSHIGLLDVVEVYDGYQWRKIQSLPKACSWMKSALHEGNWYLAGGTRQGHEVYYASLESLMTTTNSEEAGQTSVWEKLPDAPLKWSTPAILGNQLIIVGRGYSSRSAIHAYSPSVNTWIHVGDLPVACSSPSTLVLPTGELLLVGANTNSGLSSSLFKANIRVISFIDGCFDMSALDRLEKVADIPIFNKLAVKFLDMATALHFHESLLDDLRKENNSVEGSKAMFKAWLSGDQSPQPPTWQVLLKVLETIEMAELAKEIQQFFNRRAVVSPSQSMMSECTKEELESDLSVFESKEQQTKHCRDVAVQTHGEATCVWSTGTIRGVEVNGEVEFIFLNQGGSFEWKGYGLKLHISKGSLPSGMEKNKIKIRASFSGQFHFPDDLDLFSPVFWISTSCKFTKPVTLEIQHCALREDGAILTSLSFVSAKCSQKDLPYRFRQVEGGVFTTHSSYGSLQLSHFSGYAVAGSNETPRSYCGHLYYSMKDTYDWRYYFVITQDLDAKNTVVREHYSLFAKQEATLRIKFESSEITLDIPTDGLVKEGWSITPLSSPTISKEDADQFERGQWIPGCQLIVLWEKEDQKPVRLRHKVGLIGAKAPHNFFHLTLNLVQETQEEGVRYLSYSQAQTPHLRGLLDALYHRVANKWKVIGVYLEISDLDSIETKHRGDPHLCLLDMLDAWLKRVDPPPTWSVIIEAVEFLGEKQLGRELREKYISKQ